MPKNQEVWIFYSSETEPELPVVYAQGIQYLHESDIKTHVLDVHKHPELAEKHKIMATPVIIIEKGKEAHKILGVANGLRKLLTADFHGKSILHLLGFKEGRDIAKALKIPKKKQEIEKALKSSLNSRGISNFKLIKFDIKKNYARISLTSNLAKEHEKSKTPVCFEVSALLGGVFTEIFEKGTHFKELKCTAKGNDCCKFETMEGKINSGGGAAGKNFSKKLGKSPQKNKVTKRYKNKGK
jgi:predicted hydrocarbon binding protein